MLITLMPDQNGQIFADEIFECIFGNQTARIPVEIPLIVLRGTTDDESLLLFNSLRPSDAYMRQ